MKKKDIGTEEVLYRFGLVAALVVASGYLFLQFAPASLREWIDRYSFCVIYRLTGFTCPGCGGTRAVGALLHGQVLLSVLYHPLVLYGLVLYGTFMLSHTAAKLSGRHIGMKWKNGYVTAAIWLLVGNFIIKNLIHLITGLDVLAALDHWYIMLY